MSGRTRRGTERLWGESWYFDFTDRAGTLGGYVRLGLYPNLGVAWYWACLVGEGRPLVTVIDHEVALPEGPVARDAGRRPVGRPHRRDALRAHEPRLRGLRGLGGRPRRGLRRPAGRPGALRPRPRVGDRRRRLPVDRHDPLRGARAPSTARSWWATRRSPSTASASGTTAGACGTGGPSAGCGRPAVSTTAPGSTPPACGSRASTPSPPATSSRPGGTPEQIEVCAAEEELDEQGFPVTASLTCGAARPVDRAGGLLPGAPRRRRRHRVPRHARFPRALCRFEAADGRTGVGWTEWNQPG